MSKNPSDTWFYNDWENDPELKACSLAAQGLWMRLLCIAARSPERGVVQIGSLDFSRTTGLPQIAAAVGRPLEEIAPLINELISSRAASVDRRNRILNRRMVKAAKTSVARAQSGRNGAVVTNGKRWKKIDLCQQNLGNSGGKIVDKPSASSSLPSSSSVTTTSSVSSSARATARESELPDGWKPSEADVAEIQGERPDLAGDVFERRQRDFRDWCASKAVTSCDWGATWRTFMRQTHSQPASRAAARADAASAAREPLQITGPRGIWYVRLTSHRPGSPWPDAHGPAPESDQDNPNLNDDQRRQWRRYHGFPAEWRKDVA